MRFTFDMQRNTEVLYKLISIFWVCAARHAQATQNKRVAYIYNISRNAWGMKLIFCLHINTKVFYKLIGSISVYVVRLAQSTQINKILISMQYLKENGENKVGFFLLADEYQRLIQTDNIVFSVCVRACPNFPKKFLCNVFAIF